MVNATTNVKNFSRVVTFNAPNRNCAAIALGQSNSYRYEYEGNTTYKTGVIRIYTGVTSRSTYVMNNAADIPPDTSSFHPNGLTYYNGKLYACANTEYIFRVALTSDEISVSSARCIPTVSTGATFDERKIGSIAYIGNSKFLVRHGGLNFGIYEYDSSRSTPAYVEVASSSGMVISGLISYFQNICSDYVSDGELTLTANDIDYKNGYIYITFWDKDGYLENGEKATHNYVAKVSLTLNSDYSFSAMQLESVDCFDISKITSSGDSDLKKLEIEGVSYTDTDVYFVANCETEMSLEETDFYLDEYANAENRDGIFKYGATN